MKHHHKGVLALAFAVFIGIVLYATRLGTDDEIMRRVIEALQTHPAVNANELDVSFADGVVVMQGRFPDRESQRAAIEVARGIRGVERVVDRTTVGGPDEPARQEAPGKESPGQESPGQESPGQEDLPEDDPVERAAPESPSADDSPDPPRSVDGNGEPN